MRAGTNPAELDGRRYARAEWIRRLLALGAGPVVGLTPRRLLFPALWRASSTVARAGELAGFHTADSLDPDLRGLALRELIRACRSHLGYAPFVFVLDNEQEIRRLHQQGKGVLWCGLHHALGSVIVRILQLWEWPAAMLATQPNSPAWGGSEWARSVRPGPAALLGVRRALERGCATVTMLDSGRQSPPRVTVHENLLEIARRAGSSVVAYRAEVDPREPAIRIRTCLGPAAGCDSDQFWPQARAAVERLYGADWGLQLEWTSSAEYAQRRPVQSRGNEMADC